MSRAKEALGVLRGAQVVIEAGRKLQEDSLRVIWTNSSIRNIARNFETPGNPLEVRNLGDLAQAASEIAARIDAVLAGIRAYASYTPPTTTTTVTAKDEPNSFTANKGKIGGFQIKLTASDKALLKKLDMEHRQKLAKMASENPAEIDVLEVDAQKETKGEDNVPKVTSAVPNPKSKQLLDSSAKQRKVPSSRIGRMVSFGTLAAGLGIGTLAEYTRRGLGIGGASETSLAFLTDANMERIVDTLCKVRGAALKIGQILSIQDDTIINPRLSKALERVRKSADFMPNWQLEKVMASELGENWKEALAEFQDKPFAAASIGQVHWAKTKEGKEVAIKIQYPGVAQGIESDIDNLVAVMNLWNVFPEGMFLDNMVKVAKRELAWEVDYIREAECTKKFRTLLEPYPDYYVPEVIENLSTRQVFTTELLAGIPVDQCAEMDDSHRSFVASKILELILIELLEFRYMQTDPNWANFLYNPVTKKILLLDFGASREYSEEFVKKYINLIKASIDCDRGKVLAYSRDIGFLTGYESKLMEEAHVDAGMILGEVFKTRGLYDFSKHNTTERLQKLVPTMITHRLCPPPEEIYSLHRKLSGIFMLCARLKARIPARDIFFNMYDRYKAQQK